MAEESKIAWTDSTYNPWIGCTKVSVSAADGGTEKGGACDHCYAEQLDKLRFSKTMGGATKVIPISHWGPGAPRYRTAASNAAQVHKWNKAREIAMGKFALGQGPKPPQHRVFCASLADVLDNEVPAAWRADLWALIHATPYLDWLLVTKRIVNATRMVPALWISNGFPKHVRLIISVSNQFEADRDIPKLLALPCKNGISYEPALGPVDFYGWMGNPQELGRSIEWIIVGGESTQGAGKARPFYLAWPRSAVAQCKAADVPVFVKQFGSNARFDEGVAGEGVRYVLHARAGEDPREWPKDLQIQEFPA